MLERAKGSLLLITELAIGLAGKKLHPRLVTINCDLYANSCCSSPMLHGDLITALPIEYA